MEISNLAGLEKPLVKLIEVVEGACGAVFKPYQIRRIALAEADSKRILEAANMEAAIASADRLSQLNDRTLAHIGATQLSVEERAKVRVKYQEIRRQQNIECIVYEAAAALKPSASDDKPDEDWVFRFFGAAAEVGDPEMQTLWGKILARETESPGRYSVRTLDVVRNLSKLEAQAFMELGCFLWGDNEFILLPPSFDVTGQGELHAMEHFGFTAGQRSLLVECGLLAPSVDMGATFGELDSPIVIFYNGIELEFKKVDVLKPISSLPALFLTLAGRQLGRLIPNRVHDDYIDELITRYVHKNIAITRLSVPTP